jgi:hypothetical protein
MTTRAMAAALLTLLLTATLQAEELKLQTLNEFGNQRDRSDR